MNEAVLNSIIKLFALIKLYDKAQDALLSYGFVKLFLKRQFNDKVQNEQLENYESCLVRYHSESASTDDYESVILTICKRINKGITRKQKILILISLLQYLKSYFIFSFENDSQSAFTINLLLKIARIFNIDDQTFENIQAFINNNISNISPQEQLLIINQDKHFSHQTIKHVLVERMYGQLAILHLPEYQLLFFNYKGETPLNYNGTNIYADLTYNFEPGSFLTIVNLKKVFYSEILLRFMDIEQGVSLCASEIKYRFPKASVGIEPFSFKAHSGELVGIMGISGSGKSTLLNLLNGTLPLKSGDIFINGWSLINHKEKLDGLIGHVPQDDLIIEELTVFQNLYYNAKMCFGQLSEEEIIQKVNQELEALDIFEIKDLPAGNPLNKFISGGQRKRLNIALETIRKPSILFIDEPTSGLSSSDSEKIIDLLKTLTFSGKLLFINIHQPSSSIFKNLDKLLVLDKGGIRYILETR